MDFGSYMQTHKSRMSKCDFNKLCKYTFSESKSKKSLKVLIRYVLFLNTGIIT